MIPLPLVSEYPKGHPEQPGGVKEQCPDCGRKVWVSTKKRAMRDLGDAVGKEVVALCYRCFPHFLSEHRNLINELVQVNM